MHSGGGSTSSDDAGAGAGRSSVASRAAQDYTKSSDVVFFLGSDGEFCIRVSWLMLMIMLMVGNTITCVYV